MSDLCIHHFEPLSRANGPGRRAVVWVQGCSLGCPGCFAPSTHPFEGGEMVDPEDLADRIATLSGVDGVTLTGGEPLQQRDALIEFLRCLRRRTRLSVIVFTGYSWDELMRIPDAQTLLLLVDAVIAGRYERDLGPVSGLLSSTNQTLHLLSRRFAKADFDVAPEAEVIITSDGEVLISGIGPPVS